MKNPGMKRVEVVDKTGNKKSPKSVLCFSCVSGPHLQLSSASVHSLRTRAEEKPMGRGGEAPLFLFHLPPPPAPAPAAE